MVITKNKRVPNSVCKKFLLPSTFVVLSFVACKNDNKTESKTRNLPNIVLILADDLGYSDLAVYGNTKVNTPNTTRLANEGILFTDFHSNGANCAPTRAALLTGRYQQRTGVEKIGGVLNDNEILVAEYLRNAGYKTGLFGKWHISGHLQSYEFFKEKNPVHYGFDEFKGFMSGFIDYQSHLDPAGNLDWWHNDQLVNEKGYSTHLLTNHAVRFIEQNQNNPFFLYMSFAQIHLPWMTPDDPPYFEEGKTYDTAGEHPNSRLGPHDGSDKVQKTVQVMIEELDKGIGKIINAIKRVDIAENTLVFFASDNGGYIYYRRGGQLHHYGQISSNFPYRGQKGTLYEGGHRVPAIAWWPGKILPGKKSHEAIMTHDLFPTFLELAGIDLPGSNSPNKIDGESLLPLLTEGKMLPERNLFWALRDMRAVRQGDWKLVKNGEDAPELYNLKHDPGETNNLATYFTERTDSLLNSVIFWESDVFSN